MRSQVAYASLPDPYDGSEAEPDVSLIDELRLTGRIGGGIPGHSKVAGIRNLMLAVLDDAIRCFLGSNRMDRREAEVWISMATQASPFSFVTICHVLGLDPGAARAAMYRMREHNPSRWRALGRSRPNVRKRGRISLRKRSRRR
jgi:hypothetical protein